MRKYSNHDPLQGTSQEKKRESDSKIQAYHNLRIENNYMEDPKLTPFGDLQCRLLRQNFPRHEPIDLLVCSPLRRTIYTTLISFQPEIEQRGLKVIALPELQEVGDWPCDTGSDIAILREELEGKPVDLSRVPDDWNNNQGEWGPADDVVNKRAAKVRQWLKARSEKNIVVVTHGGLVHYLTCDWTGDGKFEGVLHACIYIYICVYLYILFCLITAHPFSSSFTSSPSPPQKEKKKHPRTLANPKNSIEFKHPQQEQDGTTPNSAPTAS